MKHMLPPLPYDYAALEPHIHARTMYAIEAGPPTELTEKLISLVLTVVAASIAVHGISATPVMRRSGAGVR